MSPPIEPLEFPRGMRFPRPDEVPAHQREEVAAKIAAAQVTTGYIEKLSEDSRFSAYFEVNAQARHVWELFVTLVKATLPRAATPLIGWKDEEPMFGPLTETDRCLAVFGEYSDHLSQDGFVQFGVIYENEGQAEEILVSPAKYIQIWTSHPEATRDVLRVHALEEVQGLHFIDEYPSVTEWLADEANTTAEVIESIKSKFEYLPGK